MAITQSENGNGNRNQQPQPHVIEQVPIVAAAPDPITMVGVQVMIQMMLDRQMEETRRLLLQDRDEPTMPVKQPELNDGQSEGGNYNGTVGQANPPIVRRNNQDDGDERNGRK